MKNFMKKIIVGFFAFVLLFVGHSAFASNVFNGQSGDCSPTIGIGNYTTGNIPRDGYGCWTSSSISASSGDTINVGMYYHNNTDSTLSNVRAVVSRSSSGPASSYSFTGSMSSDQGNQTFGTVTLNLSSSQTLTYSSTHLMKGKSAVLSDTDTAVYTNEGGIDVGSVPPGWDDYGTIIFVYKVGSTNQQTCQDSTATNYGGSLPCNYPQVNNCTISNFTANGSNSTTITSGNAVNLVWNTNNCTSVNVSGPNGYYNSSLSNSATVYPTSSGNYTLNAYGQTGGTQTRTVYVNVNDIQYNNCTISNFTANGSNSTTITSGNAVNLVWNTNNCTSVNVSGPNGYYNSSLSNSATVYPTSSGNYTLNAYGQTGGTQTRTVYVNVNSPYIVPDVPPVYVNDCAVTTVATNVGQNSAILNGLITRSNGASYFEYGTSVNLGSRTSSRVGSGSYNEVISGLLPNTIYYFRFVSQCGNGLSYGKIEIFRTQVTITNTQIIRQIVTQGTTVVGTQSPIMLKIENRYQSIGVGDNIDYTVMYKNIGKSLLTHPVLQVIVPQGIILTNSSSGTYSNETNTLTVQLEDLKPGQEGVVYLQARVDTLPSNTAQIVTTAILVYTNPNGAQENAIAYVLNNPKNLVVNNLGASAFWSGFFSIGLIGWLLIIILILLIILISRRYYGNKSVVHTTTPLGDSHTTTTTNY